MYREGKKKNFEKRVKKYLKLLRGKHWQPLLYKLGLSVANLLFYMIVVIFFCDLAMGF